MGYKIFLIVCNLLIPLLMFVFGRIFERHAPGRVNGVYGYRTARSMKNQETWDFAHQCCGRIWQKAGSIMGLISVTASVFVLTLGESEASYVCIALIALQTVVLIVSIYPVERALKEKFDENGIRRGGKE